MKRSAGVTGGFVYQYTQYSFSIPTTLTRRNPKRGGLIQSFGRIQAFAPLRRNYSEFHSNTLEIKGLNTEKRATLLPNSAWKRSSAPTSIYNRSPSSLSLNYLEKRNTSCETSLRTLVQSSLGNWATVLLLTFISSAFLYTSTYSQPKTHTPPKPQQVQIDPEQEYYEYFKMTGETLPGRPGTLTAHEEEKLREFWVATLQVFGVLDPQADTNGTSGDSEVSNGVAKSDTSAPEKPKKKRFSALRRKNKDEDAASTKSASAASRISNASDADDKYGQTKEFHDALASLPPASIRATFWSMVKYDHPDALLLRFLRARKWDVDKALVMMISTMRWRASDMHVDDDIMKNGELAAVEDEKSTNAEKKRHAEGFLMQMRSGKSFLHGLDKAGRPMCFVRARLHKQGEQSEESLERYTVFIIESARMLLEPPVDTACVVFDMTGFSLANMDYGPVKFMIKCFEANYPESLGVVLVHRAPWVFQGIWKIIRGWLDPVVASKVQFTNNVEEMSEFVPRSQILAELGGDENWEYKFVEPVPGENDLMKDTATRDKLLKERENIVDAYEKATMEWINSEGKTPDIKTRRTELAKELREDYWKLDPYVRAKSLYDRTGVINPGGKLDFYPKAKAETAPAVAAAAAAPAVETSADDID
ncbi:putative cral trio domain-containing protein [Botrytis fragariae]|uniref:Putative cral trio domain-containing protein n=1 Tax=Botrytis fragariae TaxID=1964551 RepID=A0A8H6AZH9_9HELO|nr:putative cral trio domain-containing protein [Botrytis fragariae]KAF5876454.1 putative cral trio domain-containing protein [Botrytis fragariae]